MRPKIVIPVCLLGALLVLAVLYLRPTRPVGQPAPPEDAGAQASSDPAAADTNAIPRRVARAQPNAKSVSPAPAETTSDPAMDAGTPAEQHQAYVEARIADLQDLAANPSDDKDSLQSILAELTNRDPEIRKAAVEAAKQFGNRDAIPGLQDAMTQTDDAVEKADINDAIEFLKLPSLTELKKPGGH